MEASNGELYGKGCFTTIAVRNGIPLFWEKHWARLERDSAKIGVDVSEFSATKVFQALNEEIRSSGISNGRARVTFLDQRSGDIWPGKTEQNTTMSMLVGERRQLPTKFSVTASPYRVNTYSPLVGVKSCNYLENLLGIEEARSRGFHEAIRINNEGAMTGGCMSNIYWLKNGELFTPQLETGCLPGTTREHMLESIACHELRAPIDTLIAVDAIFLSSAGLGVIQVNDLDNRAFDPIDHPILHLIP